MKPDQENSLQLTADTTFDKIEQYYLSGGTERLTNAVDEIRQRWFTAFTLLMDFSPEREVVNYLVATYSISEAQAYRDIRNAKTLFGNVNRANKEAERIIASEMAKRLFQSAAEKFKETGKVSYFKMQIEAMKLHAKVNTLDFEDLDLPDPAKLVPHTQVLQISPEVINGPYFEMMDTNAKDAIMKIINKVKKILKDSIITDYLDINEILPIKDRSQENE